MWFRPPRSETIVGSAVETIVWSSEASSITSSRPHMTSRTRGAAEVGGDTAAAGIGVNLGDRRAAPKAHRRADARRPVDGRLPHLSSSVVTPGRDGVKVDGWVVVHGWRWARS